MIWTEQAIAEYLSGKFVHVDRFTGHLTEAKVDADFVKAYSEPVPYVRTEHFVPRQKWTEEEVANLVRLRQQGLPFKVIGKAIGRTRYAAMKKHQELVEQGLV